MKRIFVTHILPLDKVEKYKLSFAPCNFSWNLINGGGFENVYSILPSFVHEDITDVNMEGLVYSTWRTGNKLKRRFAPLVEQLKVFRLIPNGSSVWFYNLTTLVVLILALLKVFKPKVKVNIIVLDFDYKYRLDRCFLPLINKAHGLILLANSPLFTNKNKVCLPGVVPQSDLMHSRIERIKKEFLISGMLGENISLLRTVLIPAFKQMPNCVLHISGIADDEERIREMIEGCDNMKFHGKIPYPEYKRLLSEVPFLLSTRDACLPENRCNFPSKVMEALLYNRIIISTIHYNQLDGIKYFEVCQNVDEFISDINRIVSKKEEEILSYANQEALVKEKFSTEIWNNIMSYIENRKQ